MKLVLLLTIVLLLVACGGEPAAVQPSISGSPGLGDAARGKELVSQYGCTACHAIPAIDGRHGALGPSLEGLGSRPTFGDGVPNNPETLTAFIVKPQAVDPNNRMPPLGVTREDARHMATFLATLK